MRKLFLLPALLLVLEATPALSLSNSPYLARGAFDVVNLLPPPPGPNSAEQRRDVEGVLEAQRASTPERMRLAQADAKVDLTRFADVLGPNFVPDRLPAVVAFFRKVGADTGVFLFLSQRAFDLWRGHRNSTRQYGARKTQRAVCARLGLRLEPRGRRRPFSHRRRIRQNRSDGNGRADDAERRFQSRSCRGAGGTAKESRAFSMMSCPCPLEGRVGSRRHR